MHDVVDRMLDAMNAHDLHAVLRCYAPGAVVVGPEMEAGEPGEIGSYVMQMWRGFPDLRFTVWETISFADVVATEMTAVGTHTGPYLVAGGDLLAPTGRGINVRVSWFWHLKDGRILSQRFYYDQLQIYSQLGLLLPLSFEDDDAGSGTSGDRGQGHDL
ncbi:ester cyclase [Microbispora sp. H10885]|uniref:ester cyclase n=1 Tax=Microbispora sp. H10885 TaxID=2729110 RepID=UPI0015FEFFF9|nr:ester cyclase [Microbispora sp. H10885]